MEAGRVCTSDGWPFVHGNVVRDSTSSARRASSVHVLVPGRCSLSALSPAGRCSSRPRLSRRQPTSGLPCSQEMAIDAEVERAMAEDDEEAMEEDDDGDDVFVRPSNSEEVSSTGLAPGTRAPHGAWYGASTG